jgi:hypothetical protein
MIESEQPRLAGTVDTKAISALVVLRPGTLLGK